MELGTHCNYKYCKQRDFLPFNCSLCSGRYCIDHRTSTAHECKQEATSKKAIVCPICNTTIQYTSALTDGEAWEIHYATDCNESKPKTQEMRCPVAKCNAVLKTVNKHNCQHCGREVCLKHRMPEDHQCLKTQPRQQQGQYNFANNYNQNVLKNPWL